MDPCSEDPLYGFGHNMKPIRDIIYLPVVFGISPKQISHTIKFYMISSSASYNMILERPTLTNLRVTTSTTHSKVKFPIQVSIGEGKGDREMVGRCYDQALVMEETETGIEIKLFLFLRDRAGKSTGAI